MADTVIEWADKTWNPIVGCKVISPGCTNCYAMRMAARLEAMGQDKYRGLTQTSKAGPVWTGRHTVDDDALLTPLSWRRPSRIFLDSMGDPFLEGVPPEAVDRVLAVVALSPQHDYIMLTKRPDAMRRHMLPTSNLPFLGRLPLERIHLEAAADIDGTGPLQPLHQHGSLYSLYISTPWPLPNLWLGTSVESRAQMHRIDALRETPAAVRVISFEPLLEDIGPVDLTGIHWVIVGGESGRGARPMHPDWVRNLRDQCIAQGVAFFFKQWGEYLPVGQTLPGYGKVHGATAVRPGRMKLHYGGNRHQPPSFVYAEHGVDVASMPDCLLTFRVGKKAAGRILDGRTWDEAPKTSLRAAA